MLLDKCWRISFRQQHSLSKGNSPIPPSSFFVDASYILRSIGEIKGSEATGFVASMFHSEIGNCGKCFALRAPHKCSKYVFMRYCSAECQKQHWPFHRQNCGKIGIEAIHARLSENPPWSEKL